MSIDAMGPVAWKDTMHTDHADGRKEHEPMLLGYEGWEKLPDGTDLYTTPQPAIPDGMVLVPVEPVKTADPEISREHLVAIAEKCGLLGAYRTREVVDAIVGYGQVILRDKAVQEAMYRALLSTSPKKGNADV